MTDQKEVRDVLVEALVAKYGEGRIVEYEGSYIYVLDAEGSEEAIAISTQPRAHKGRTFIRIQRRR
jgi:hypothetical protein